jgi:ribulose-phosphate 3-epimerase
MGNRIRIAPSILSAKLERLGEEIAEVEAAGADWIHVDVMDGQFVPPITYGATIVRAARRVTKLPLDVHLMVRTPENQVRDFAESGADIITVHVEASLHLQATLAQVRSLGVKAGVVLSPHTPETALEYVLDDVDLVLVMSVNPGYGGQRFLDAQLPKLERIAERREQRGLDFLLEIDGGINLDTARKAISAGAEVLVAGTAIFGEEDRARALAQLRKAAAG